MTMSEKKVVVPVGGTDDVRRESLQILVQFLSGLFQTMPGSVQIGMRL